MPTTLKVTTYQSPGTVIESKSHYEPISNCARQTFKPVAQAKLTTTEADSPSGIDLIKTERGFGYNFDARVETLY
jgi:hypothetical protein